MWGFCTLVVAGWAASGAWALAPPYLQSRSAFTHTRLDLQVNMPHRLNDITSPESRKHITYGIYVAVTAMIAKNHSTDESVDSLTIMEKMVPLAWENYNLVAQYVNQLLAEAHAQIRPVISLIDAICSASDSVETCNEQVEDKVEKSDKYVQHRARLLLALGAAATTASRREDELDHMARTSTAVPYLLRRVHTDDYRNFIRQLSNVYNLLRKSNNAMTLM